MPFCRATLSAKRFIAGVGGRTPASPLTTAPRNRVKPYLLFPWAAELVRHPRLLDLVEAVIGPDILVFHTTVWMKAAHSENYVPWHQDATYFGLAPFEHVTAWVALTPSRPESGCVRVIPGSHHNGQLAHFDNHNDPLTMLSRGQKLADAIREEDAVNLVLEPGDMSLHHTLTVHSSRTNRSDDWRIGVGISYIPASVRHIGPTRLSATLARGTDRFSHFDHEAAPQAELDDAALGVHADSQSRYWQAASGITEMRHIH
jgi:non-heme Fe2+,alpha-ketoglutarate-dependent halogenase